MKKNEECKGIPANRGRVDFLSIRERLEKGETPEILVQVVEVNGTHRAMVSYDGIERQMNYIEENFNVNMNKVDRKGDETDVSISDMIMVSQESMWSNGDERAKELRSRFEKAIEEVKEPSLLITVVTLPSGAPEVMIDGRELEDKIKYIKKAYGEDMAHLGNSKIKILDFIFV